MINQGVSPGVPMNALSYRIFLRQEPEGGYTVLVPTLPGCITYGETIAEAIIMAKEAIELYLESLMAHGGLQLKELHPPPRS